MCVHARNGERETKKEREREKRVKGKNPQKNFFGPNLLSFVLPLFPVKRTGWLMKSLFATK